MAGTRQHYLPQFLQRSFANDDGRTWLFRKGERSLQTSTRNIGVERTFYTKPGDTTVDDAITVAEENLSRVVKELRSSTAGRLDNEGLPRLFAHLEVRTRHLRESFLQSSESLYSKTVPILNDTNKLGCLLRDHIARNPEKISQMMRDELRQRGLPTSSSATLIEEMIDRLPQFLQELGPELERASTNILSALPGILRSSIKDAHIKALSKTIAPETRVHNYEKLDFRTEDVVEGNMILGDCGTIFHVEGPKPFKTITEKSDIILAAILPIAPARLLIGADKDYRVEPAEVRRAVARCSLEFFIASENSEGNAQIAKLIGLAAAPLTDQELQAIVDEALS